MVALSYGLLRGRWTTQAHQKIGVRQQVTLKHGSKVHATDGMGLDTRLPSTRVQSPPRSTSPARGKAQGPALSLNGNGGGLVKPFGMMKVCWCQDAFKPGMIFPSPLR